MAIAAMLLAACGEAEDAAEPAADAEPDTEDASDPDAEDATDTAAEDEAGGEMELDEVLFAQQFGIGYAPLVVLENRPEMAEEHLPGVDIEWTVLAAGTSLRDAMLGGQLHVGSGGAGPVIDGISKGVEYSIATGLVEMPMWMVGQPDGPQSLDEFTPDHQVAVPSIASSQHVVLRTALEDAGLDPEALDDQLVPMPHPDGLAALTGGQVDAHVTSSPFQEAAVERGMEKLADSYDLWGRHHFLTVYITHEFAEENPNVFNGIVEAVREAVDWVAENPEETAEILAEAGEGDQTADEFYEQLTAEHVTFTSEMRNVKPMMESMHRLGFIDREVEVDELFFDTAGVDDW